MSTPRYRGKSTRRSLLHVINYSCAAASDDCGDSTTRVGPLPDAAAAQFRPEVLLQLGVGCPQRKQRDGARTGEGLEGNVLRSRPEDFDC